MKRQVQILMQHKANNADSFAKLYESMVRMYGKTRLDNAIKKEESK